MNKKSCYKKYQEKEESGPLSNKPRKGRKWTWIILSCVPVMSE